MLVWLCVWFKVQILHMAQMMPPPLTISCCSKSRSVLPFWCRLTRVVLDKIQVDRNMVMCVCVSGIAFSFQHFSIMCILYLCNCLCFFIELPSVLWRCWLGVRKACKKQSGGMLAWLSAWGADLHIAQQMPLPFLTISCSSNSRLVLTFLVLPFWYRFTQVVLDKV